MRTLRTELSVVLLACALAGTGVLLALPWRGAGAATAIGGLPAWAVLAVLPLAGLFAVRVQVRREAHEITARELGLVLGLALVPPGLYIVAHVLLSLLPQLWRRTAPLKVGFNAGLFAAEAGLAVATYRLLLGDASPVGLRGVVATAVTVVVVDTLGTAALEVVMRLHAAPHTPSADRLAMLAVGLVAALVSASVSLLGLVLLVTAPGAVPLLVLPFAALAVAYRSHVRLTAGHDRLALLYAFTRASGGAVTDEDAPRQLLERARNLMSAELAELHLLPQGLPGVSLRSSEVEPRLVIRQSDGWWTPALQGAVVHRRAGDAGPGPLDALAAPLYQDGVVTGVLLVVDRMGDAAFTPTDAEVFAALAGSAAVSLHNAGLVARLRAEAVVREHEARHDALTGLLNRAGLLEVLHTWGDRPHVVVVADVQGVRDVNDALGHATGDELLVAVGLRVGAQLPHAVVSRLAGGEFAVAVEGRDDGAAAAEVRRVLAAAPVALTRVELPVSAVTGTATAPAEGSTPALLLRRAELAKNRARSTGQVHADFRSSDESASRDRLGLVADLRRALEAGELRVHYQPQLDLASDRVTSVEALVRWTHPVLGPLSPEVFVPLAERSGLIDALTDFVLTEALATCAAWRRAGLVETVAVNLSASSLGPGLAARLACALEAAGLPGQALVLELTETALVADAAYAAAVMRELASLGVTLSLDDFGTGYSSLSYLRRLPLAEVKVDKSFVLRMTTDSQDAAVVRSTIALAHELGMRVVAEGVEDDASLSALRSAGCDLVQGYHLSKPRRREEIESWLSARALLGSLRAGSARG